MSKFLAYALIILMFLFLAPAVCNTFAKEPEPPTRYTLHTVIQGETLWAIAEKAYPNMDTRLGVHWIKMANCLTSCVIHEGDQMNIPDEDGPLTEPYGQD